MKRENKVRDSMLEREAKQIKTNRHMANFTYIKIEATVKALSDAAYSYISLVAFEKYIASRYKFLKISRKQMRCSSFHVYGCGGEITCTLS